MTLWNGALDVMELASAITKRANAEGNEALIAKLRELALAVTSYISAAHRTSSLVRAHRNMLNARRALAQLEALVLELSAVVRVERTLVERLRASIARLGRACRDSEDTLMLALRTPGDDENQQEANRRAQLLFAVEQLLIEEPAGAGS
ncbi:MAG: hypothetical protein H0U74_18820 [Bradymonadaceae bacterium]|nr:hypothetical protein [Lujinxingiaceae bacterium]